MPQSPPSVAVPRDAVGAQTLERMAAAPAYNRWMFDRLAPWIGTRILEVGSGIGNMSQFFAGRERVVLTDTEPAYRQALERRFAGHPAVTVTQLSLPSVSDTLAGQAFDTIVCLNVLEHIEDDGASLATLRDLLEPGGRLVLLVPALPWIYGTLDRCLGHYRRYTPRLLRRRYADVGLRMRHLEYFNLAGIPGWFVTGRILRRRMIPEGPLALYDRLVPLFKLERLLPVRLGQSLIAIGERPA